MTGRNMLAVVCVVAVVFMVLVWRDVWRRPL